jgi:predicted RND superfamily exporter protein
MAQGLFDGYMAEHGITDPNAKVRVVDLLEYLASNDTYSALLGDYASMLDSLIFAKANLESANYSRLTFNVTSGIEGKSTFDFIDQILANIPNYYTEFYITGESIACYDMASNFDEDNMLVCVCSLFFVLIILLFTFRNILLPLVLILAIQGGIWINFVFPFLLGNPVMFIGYLIITAVQMGATIDYGILLSTNYVNARATADRREALVTAMNGALPTIFTSGLILMVCGAVVGFVASQTSISSVGFLLFRGALISCIMITLVLPECFGKCILKKVTPEELGEFYQL